MFELWFVDRPCFLYFNEYNYVYTVARYLLCPEGILIVLIRMLLLRFPYFCSDGYEVDRRPGDFETPETTEEADR